jgi:hypothetical protein
MKLQEQIPRILLRVHDLLIRLSFLLLQSPRLVMSVVSYLFCLTRRLFAEIGPGERELNVLDHWKR